MLRLWRGGVHWRGHSFRRIMVFACFSVLKTLLGHPHPPTSIHWTLLSQYVYMHFWAACQVWMKLNEGTFRLTSRSLVLGYRLHRMASYRSVLIKRKRTDRQSEHAMISVDVSLRKNSLPLKQRTRTTAVPTTTFSTCRRAWTMRFKLIQPSWTWKCRSKFANGL